MPRIGINAVYLNPNRTGGAETYVRQLIHELQECDPEEKFFVFVGQDHDLALTHRHFEEVKCDVDPRRPYRRIIWEQCSLPRVLRRYDLDLAHFPYGTLPLRYRGKSVVTIHDTHRFQDPHWVPLLERRYRAIVESNIARKGRHVICVSQTDGDRVHKWIGVPNDRLTPIHHGVLDIFLNAGREMQGAASASSQDGYLLWVGRAYPQKNLDVLIHAMALLKKKGAAPRLRLVGVREYRGEHFETLVKRTDTADVVSLEPPVPHTMLPALYRGAVMLCYPSKGESFGLPVLEAMACGTPVVVAENPVFRELCEDAAQYCDPDSPEAFATAIATLLGDVSRQGDLSEQGRRRAAQFSWSRCAQATLDLYRSLVSQPRVIGATD